MKKTAVVIGGSGFVGGACVTALRRRDTCVRILSAPRLSCRSRTAGDILSPPNIERHARALAEELEGAAVLINAAGVTGAGSSRLDELIGGNSMLPALLARASEIAGVERMVHISSAAVQGRTPVLDETSSRSPFSPYSFSKALGEETLERNWDLDIAVLRPTSVHGSDRTLTKQIARLARSPLSMVAGPGDSMTPQVHVDNVAEAVATLAQLPEIPSGPVLQPWEGFTTGSFLTVLGLGHRPRVLPPALAQTSTRAAIRVFRSHAWSGYVRRAEMMLFGQRQVRSWLTDHGYKPVATLQTWRELAQELAAQG